MVTPVPSDNEVIKSTNSEPTSEPAIEGQPAQEEDPDCVPLSTQEQLQAMARRREAAVSFQHQISECRLALRYSVIGWTGTLDPVSRRRPHLPLPFAHAMPPHLPTPPPNNPAFP